MRLIVGLGNPGNRYNFTRHNAGFLALDYYFKIYKNNWKDKPSLGAIMGRIDDDIFIKPQDFYNESGRVVANYVRFYKINLSDVLVICDNFDLEFGLVRYRASGSAGGNNGLKSIDVALGTSEYSRIRIGTGNDELRKQMGDVDFVLSKFTSQEKARLPEVLAETLHRIDEWRQ